MNLILAASCRSERFSRLEQEYKTSLRVEESKHFLSTAGCHEICKLQQRTVSETRRKRRSLTI